jgi:hypothetical protein
MLASIHLADVGPRRGIGVLRRRPDAARVPGLRYATTLFAAPLGDRRIDPPQLGRVGIFALWDDDAGLDGFVAASPFAAALAGGWQARLRPINVHEYHGTRGAGATGSWPGLDGDLTDPSPPQGPVVVVTLARTKPSQGLRFARASLHAARSLYGAPGFVWATALARPPVVCTCSLWSSSNAAEAYAYGGADPGHRRAIEMDREAPFHHSGVFFRFQPTASVGGLDGRNPLRPDWMTGQAGHPGQLAAS